MKIWQPYKVGLNLNCVLTTKCKICDNHLQKGIDGLSSPQNRLLCDDCHNSIYWLPKAHQIVLNNKQLVSIQAAVAYQFPVNTMIKEFKLHHNMSMLPILVYILKQLPLPKTLCNNSMKYNTSIIIPLPTTTRRLVSRGFDPVLILANTLSHYWNIPLWTHVLMKERDYQQKELTKSERLLNMEKVFQLSTHIPSHIKTVILFDDISTTGASLGSLAKTIHLETKHTLNIYAVCLAH